MTRSLRRAGFNSELDVSRAQRRWRRRAGIVPLKTQIAQTEFAIDTLLGNSPGSLSLELEKGSPVPTVPPVVTIGLPSDLLRSRPDIRSAERAIAAANARVGQYVADYYPKFNITGYFGTDSPEFQHVFDWESRYFLIDPGISWSILDFGRTSANIEIQKAIYRQAMLSYQDTVLTALREVEDCAGGLWQRAGSPRGAVRCGKLGAHRGGYFATSTSRGWWISCRCWMRSGSFFRRRMNWPSRTRRSRRTWWRYTRRLAAAGKSRQFMSSPAAGSRLPCSRSWNRSNNIRAAA